MFALVRNNEIVQVGALPAKWHDGTRDWDFRNGANAEYLTDLGWLPMTTLPRPADTATTTHGLTYDIVEGVPTYVWTERPKTEAELAAEAEAVNEADIGDKITTVDMPAMAAILAQTNADLRADPSQEMKDMAKAIRRLDRKVEHILDGSE